jgi:hypothetical protein
VPRDGGGEIFDDFAGVVATTPIGTCSAFEAVWAVSHFESGLPMFHDDCVGSCESIDQIWFAMLLVNDPNAELVGALRESVAPAALAEAFEASDGSVAAERPEGLRSRAPLWVASGLIVAALAVVGVAAELPRLQAGLASVASERAELRIGATALLARDPLPRAEGAAVTVTRPLRARLGMEPAPSETAPVALAPEAEQGQAAATPAAKKASASAAQRAVGKRRASRNWLAMSRLASR